MKNSKLFVIACLIHSVSCADVVTHNLTDASASVAQFDSALGTLTSVTFSITTPSPTTGWFQTSDFVWDTVGVFSFISVDVGGIDLSLYKSIEDEINAISETDYVLNGPSLGDSDSETITGSLTGFIGGGTLAVIDSQEYTVGMKPDFGEWEAVSNITGVDMVISDNWSGTLSYNYEAVPEPATMGLMGVAGLLIFLKRRFSSFYRIK